MGNVDEVGATIAERGELACVEGRVVPQVSRHINIDSRRPGRVKESVSRAADNRNSAHPSAQISGDPNSVSRAGQCGGDPSGKLFQRRAVVKFAYAPRSQRGTSRRGNQRPRLPQPDGVGKGVGNPTGGVVSVGMGVGECDATRDQRVNHGTLSGVGRHRCHTAKHERMVSDEQLSARFDGLARHSLGGIYGQVDQRELGVRSAHGEAIDVPLLGEPDGKSRLEGCEGVADGGHALNLPARRAVFLALDLRLEQNVELALELDDAVVLVSVP